MKIRIRPFYFNTYGTLLVHQYLVFPPFAFKAASILRGMLSINDIHSS
jgi:hypothetical protein